MVGEVELLGSEPRRKAPGRETLPVQANYRISFETSPTKVKVRFNGALVAESRRAVIMRETRYAPVYYIPRDDIRMDLLERSDHRTHCPFKGNASYWSLTVDGKTAENVAWSYEEPLPEAAPIRGYMAFYSNQVEAWYEDGRDVDIPTPDGTGGYANRFADWMLREAWDAATTEELVERLARSLVERGVPLWRLALIVRTLHPELAGHAYLWKGDQDALEVRTIPYRVLQSPAYLDSPLVPIIEGSGGIRRRLDIDNPQIDFPVIEDLRSKGATDYVAMPLTFSDGQINVVTLTSNRPGGFSTDDLGQIYEVMPLLSRLIEVHALRHMSKTLLDTYLGAYTGEQVLTGRITRGDSENVPAVIWMCDLRGSTERAERMPREDYLKLLNDFFDCTAGAVLEQGGEVLKFIGDGVLAIFPIAQSDTVPAEDLCSKPSPEAEAALARALAAVREACFRVDQLNQVRAEDGLDALEFVMALHKGEVAYGNVGVPGRLDFTVTGSTANEVARLAVLAKSLDQRVVFSECVAASAGETVVPLGAHDLPGVSGDQKVFTLDPETLSRPGTSTS